MATKLVVDVVVIPLLVPARVDPLDQSLNTHTILGHAVHALDLTIGPWMVSHVSVRPRPCKAHYPIIWNDFSTYFVGLETKSAQFPTRIVIDARNHPNGSGVGVTSLLDGLFATLRTSDLREWIWVMSRLRTTFRLLLSSPRGRSVGSSIARCSRRMSALSTGCARFGRRFHYRPQIRSWSGSRSRPLLA